MVSSIVSRLLVRFIGGPCIYKCLERSAAKNYCSVSLLSVVSSLRKTCK